MNEHDEYTATISIYEDLYASAGSDELEYTSLCEDCAEGRDVTCLSTVAAGEWGRCDECGSFNREEEEEEEDFRHCPVAGSW